MILRVLHQLLVDRCSLGEGIAVCAIEADYDAVEANLFLIADTQHLVYIH